MVLILFIKLSLGIKKRNNFNFYILHPKYLQNTPFKINKNEPLIFQMEGKHKKSASTFHQCVYG